MRSHDTDRPWLRTKPVSPCFTNEAGLERLAAVGLWEEGLGNLCLATSVVITHRARTKCQEVSGWQVWAWCWLSFRWRHLAGVLEPRSVVSPERDLVCVLTCSHVVSHGDKWPSVSGERHVQNRWPLCPGGDRRSSRHSGTEGDCGREPGKHPFWQGWWGLSGAFLCFSFFFF